MIRPGLRRYWIGIAVFGVCSTLILLAWVFFLRSPETPLPPPPADAIYRNVHASIDDRMTDLVSRMTLDEKIGQMALVEKNSLSDIGDVSRYGIGAVLSGMGGKPVDDSASGWLEMVRRFDEKSRESRLGIPILYGADAIHGHGNVPGATIFPHSIGLGAAGDEDLVERISRATSNEARATGISWVYSPTLDLPQDIRWGRTYEAFSDDPNLASRLGAAFVRGARVNAAGDESGAGVIATAKHFIGAGAMVWGSSRNKNFRIDQGNTIPNSAALDDSYLPPFKAAVDAGVSSVMVGLNSWGEDAWMSYEKGLVTDQLKEDLGFKGFAVSDWYGVYEHSPLNPYDALVRAVNAGIDMVMLPFDYKGFLMNMRIAVRNGDISESRIDDAVRRILRAKFAAGLFDRPLAGAAGLASIGSPDHRALAREAVSESMVLLKNDGVLPISPKARRILVAGSAADNIGRQCGAWTVEWQGIDGNWLPGATSILQGIRDVVSPQSSVEYEANGDFPANGAPLADIGIAVVGEKPYAEGWGDNPRPSLDQADLDAIARVSAASKKAVVVIVSGRPLFISDEMKSWNALVEAWLPGSEGEGVADVLFGDRRFTGKLPLPWPASPEQLPISKDGTAADGTQVLFPRYFGLTY